MKNLVNKIFNGFENCFLKNYQCICCFREIRDDTKFMICKECFQKLEVLGGSLCEKCGDCLTDGGFCANDCQKYHYKFSSNVSMFYYLNSAAKIIKNLKYGNKKYIAKYIAEIMLIKFKSLGDIDFLTYVPMSEKRIRERGFNQSREIAIELAKILNLEVLDLLIKSKETTHQAGGSQKERLENLKNSFRINDKYIDYAKGKNILIIDDVFTTGSTLNECAKEILKCKPKKIKTLTFAKTKFNALAAIE